MKEINLKYPYGYLRAVDCVYKIDLEEYLISHFRQEVFETEEWKALKETDSISILKSIQIEERERKKGYGTKLMKEYLSKVEGNCIVLIADESRSGKTLPNFYKIFGFEIVINGLHPIMAKNLSKR